MIKKSLKELFFSIFIAIFFLIILEGISHAVYKTTRLDRILNVLTENNFLFWKLKPNLNISFMGENLVTNANSFRPTENEYLWKDSKTRIAVMGASPSFGWGVSKRDTYSSQIAINSNQMISVKNFSQIGYSSYQGTKLLTEVLKSKPTHLLISYVINDLDFFRFFYPQNIPDKEVQTSSKITITARNFVKELVLPKIILKFFAPNKLKIGSQKRFSRVSKKDYIKNIDRIVKKSQNTGVIPVLIKFPVNIHIEDKVDQKHFQIKSQSHIYNNALEEYSKEHEIDLIDFVEVVKSSNEYLFLDPNGDTVHPNKKGHKLFAVKILKYFKRKLKIEGINI